MLFFGSYGNEKCLLDNERKIHAGKLCEKFKTQGKQAFKRCLKCKNLALAVEGHIRILLEKYSNEDKSTNSLIENIKSYINSNLESELEITAIAKIFHFNPKYLGRLFKKESGMSINEYICNQRLERSRKVLSTSRDSVLNISFSVGFKNVTYFNKVFKNKYGLSPTEYRAQHKN